ncbi:MAG: group II intron maturase-specific domain-containing protein [Bellilinea sp.]
MGELKERLSQFNLEIAEEKTSIIQFGRKAIGDDEDKGKPGTFDFLGFTHYCGKSKNGKFRVKRKTSRKKLKASLLKCKEWLRNNLTMPAKVLIAKLRAKVVGHYRYYGITDNWETLSNFCDKVKRRLYWWFNRRSQGKHFNWEKFNLFLSKFPLPRPKIYVNVYDIKAKLLCDNV